MTCSTLLSIPIILYTKMAFTHTSPPEGTSLSVSTGAEETKDDFH